MAGALANLWHKIVGDPRDQRQALRAAGFRDEAEAATWAAGLRREAPAAATEAALIGRIRRARPDLTLATARYIARQAGVREG